MAKKAEKEEVKPINPSVDFGQFGATGFENVTQADLGIPFLMIVQKMSPEVDKESPKYIPGLEPGMIINSLNKAVYGGKGEPFVFTPYSYHRMWVEWKPRTNGGGLVKAHPTDAILAETTKGPKGEDMLRNGNIIVNTAYLFGAVLETSTEPLAEPIHAVLSFTSTQLKKARGWLSHMQALRLDIGGNRVTPPMFAYRWKLSTTPESNDKGTWYGWKIEIGEIHTDGNLVKLLAAETKKNSDVRQLQIAASGPTDDTI